MAQRVRLLEAGFEHPMNVESFDLATPGPGQVLVEVGACGVCHRDLIDRAGRFPWLQLPITPGHEAAGRVVAVGEGADSGGFAVGDRVATLHRDWCGSCAACERGDSSLCPNAVWVFGLIVDGGYATHLVAPVRALYPLTAPEPDDLLCFLHCTAGTAFRGLTHYGGVAPGQRVLITGANGGVGAAAVQIAKRLGCSVTAVVRSEATVDFVKAMGADRVVVDDGGGFHKKAGPPADVALDCVGSPTFNSSLRSVRMGGRVVVIGNVTAERASFNLGYAIVNGLQVNGSSGATRADMEALQVLHAETPLDLKAMVAEVMPLERAEAAHQALRQGGLRGRLVLG